MDHLDEISINTGKRILNVRLFLLEKFVFGNIVPIFETIDILSFSIIGLQSKYQRIFIRRPMNNGSATTAASFTLPVPYVVFGVVEAARPKVKIDAIKRH